VVTRTIDRASVRGVLDSEVQRPDNKVIGRAVDLTTDASGTPRELIVNLQGFMGVGDRKAAFPWSGFHFTPSSKGPPITLTLPQNQIAALNRSKPSASLGTPLAGIAATPDVPPGQLQLLDTDVERPNGAKVGRVIDVLVDGNAQPQAVVLDVSGIINPDRRSIAANWSALHFTIKDKALHALMDLNDAQIKASPSYESGKPVLAVSPAPPATATAPTATAASVTAAPASTPPPAASGAPPASPAAATASSARPAR
jgi:hypothetical protein